jgi:hypothetical protein
LPFSCRERTGKSLQKTTILRAERVRWNFHDGTQSLLTRETHTPYTSSPIWYHSITVGQKLRPDPPLEMIIPCWNLVPNHTRLPHWRHRTTRADDPDQKAYDVVVIGLVDLTLACFDGGS